MTRYFKKIKVGYTPIPKNACTSTKHCLMGLEKEFILENNVHKQFPTKGFDASYILDESWLQFCIVREPLERFISAFNNRILFFRDHEKNPVSRELMAHTDDNLGTFISKFDEIYGANVHIFHHFCPQHIYFQDILNHVNVYTMRNLDKLCEDLSNHLGKEVQMPKLQTGRPKNPVSKGDLTNDQIQWLKNRYMDDYYLLRDYLDAPLAMK